MPTMAFIRMTQQQRDAGEALNGDGIALGARQVDNPLAENLGLGTMLGQWVSPARLLNDPDYQRWSATLGTYPIHILDSDVLFLPPPPDE